MKIHHKSQFTNKVNKINFYLSVELNTAVAFSAYASVTTDYDQGTTVQFDQEVTNVGGYYDSSLGFFICPINGIYQFSASVFTDSAHYCDVNSVKDDLILLGAHSNTDDYTQASTTVFTECLSFEKVWIESAGNNYRISGGIETSFSGALIVSI